jgi:molybdenum ABC transporter molybdate-binding protein
MQKIKLLFCFFFLISLFSYNANAIPSRNLTIFADPNMALAITKIARIFSQKFNVITSVNFNFGINLIDEIDSGVPVDVFISAHPIMIDSLRNKGLVDFYNNGYIARDQLILVTTKTNSNIPQEIIDKEKISLTEALKIISKNKAYLVIDNENNSSGNIARNFINRLSLTGFKIFKKSNEEKSSLVTMIKNHQENYSLLLLSQIKNQENFQILAQDDDNIFYRSLVIAGDNMELAREFLKFLKSDQASQILKESGFLAE